MKRWISFSAIKNAVTMQHTLTRYGIFLKAAGLDALRGQCPLPTHESDSVHSFSVDTRRNIWACHSESCIRNRGGRIGGNVLDFVALMERCSIREAALLLQDGSIELPPARTTQATRPSVADRRNMPLTFQLTELLGQHPYLVARGVDEATAAWFGIGYYPGPGFLRGRIAIPIHNVAGELVGYAGRSVDSSEPKYLFPRAFGSRRSCSIFIASTRILHKS